MLEAVKLYPYCVTVSPVGHGPLDTCTVEQAHAPTNTDIVLAFLLLHFAPRLFARNYSFQLLCNAAHPQVALVRFVELLAAPSMDQKCRLRFRSGKQSL